MNSPFSGSVPINPYGWYSGVPSLLVPTCQFPPTWFPFASYTFDSVPSEFTFDIVNHTGPNLSFVFLSCFINLNTGLSSITNFNFGFSAFLSSIK